MSKFTPQMKVWAGNFGKEYTDRTHQNVQEVNSVYLNDFGIKRTDLNQIFLDDFDRSIRILEVGCNVGAQLQCLQEMGFKQLYGIVLQHYAVEKAKSITEKINIIQGSAFDIPFKNDFFDLVFTSGLLHHIHPDEIDTVLNEIYRCSRSYIWGYEYYKEDVTIFFGKQILYNCI